VAKEYTYDVKDVTTGKIVAEDITRPEILLLVGKNINLGPCLRSGSLLVDRYLVKCRREFERLNTKEYRLLAELELECRKWRGIKWSETKGFNLAAAWRLWKERQNG